MNKIKIIVIIIALALSVYTLIIGISTSKKIKQKANELTQNQEYQEENNDSIDVVASIDDNVKGNTVWCGTFQLVWNDMVNEVVKQDVRFSKQLDIVDNLNKQTFKESELSEKSYYKKMGSKNIRVKI